jgi:hypothetical protein
MLPNQNPHQRGDAGGGGGRLFDVCNNTILPRLASSFHPVAQLPEVLMSVTDTKTRPGLTVLGWKSKSSGSLRGFADIKLPNGLTVFGVGVFCANGRCWASLPSKPILGAEGVAKRDDATGKIKYVPTLEWPDRQTSDRFSAAVVDAVEAQHPGAVRS